MAPMLRGPRRHHWLAVLSAAAAAGLLFLIDLLVAGSRLAPTTLMLLSLVAGIAVVLCLEIASPRPAERYRREHERLAGPRPGARLG